MNAPTAPLASLKLKDPKLLRNQCYVDGQWVDAEGGKTLAVTNPATGELLGTVPNMGAAETRRAIEAANAAWPAWRAKTAKERSTILRKWADLMMANQEDLAIIMTAEQGKPLAESRGEIAYAASFLEWFAEEARRVYGDMIPGHQARQAHRGHQAAGRRVRGDHAVELPGGDDHAQGRAGARGRLHDGVKPASATPFSALALAELAERAGVPKGVFNVVTGSAGRRSAASSPRNPLVRKITFTGSTEVGQAADGAGRARR